MSIISTLLALRYKPSFLCSEWLSFVVGRQIEPPRRSLYRCADHLHSSYPLPYTNLAFCVAHDSEVLLWGDKLNWEEVEVHLFDATTELESIYSTDASIHCTRRAWHNSVRHIGIDFSQVTTVVSDSAAYCKKAYRKIPSVVFPRSVHVLCLAHIVNLAAEAFHNHCEFTHTHDHVTMIKSSLFKKPRRKSCF